MEYNAEESSSKDWRTIMEQILIIEDDFSLNQGLAKRFAVVEFMNSDKLKYLILFISLLFS